MESKIALITSQEAPGSTISDPYTHVFTYALRAPITCCGGFYAGLIVARSEQYGYDCYRMAGSDNNGYAVDEWFFEHQIDPPKKPKRKS